jgi:uncharacterized protein YndB with AHSA1/START domain/DNA-binding transcriptional ArsR family regulator
MDDDVFRALADPSRRALLDRLNEHNGQSLRALCAHGELAELARQSVSKHLAVLEAAHLITTVWHGREKLHYLNPEPINAIADRWISRYDRSRVHSLANLKSALESGMTKPEFVYTSYIRTTPELLWRALTEPEFTQQYWGITLDSDWQKGSLITWTQRGVVTSHPDQVVLEADPFRRLSYTWHTFTPELAEAFGFDPAFQQRAAAEARSRVTFDLEPDGDQVRLTVIHDGFEPDSLVLTSISGGWPMVISSLKSFLETGTAEPAAGRR